MTTVCILGLGYIGLPTGALLADCGYQVYGVDTRADVVSTVSAGKIHITEPDLDALVKRVVSSGRLTAGGEPKPADIFMITVPTPLTPDRRADLHSVFAAVASIAPVLERGNLVILESTCPVGTTETVATILADRRPDLDILNCQESQPDVLIAYCPERVLPGRILVEMISNDRCVGGVTPWCTTRAAEFYQSFVRGQVFRTTSATAELVKLTENASRDVSIAFANELSMVADHHGLDVWTVIALANRHPRVNILQPGPGVGGHCIAVDPWFIVEGAPEQAHLIRVAREVNDGKTDYVFQQVSRALNANRMSQITCFGLSFKADIDDLRESPALSIVARLGRAFPGRVAAVEPFVDTRPPALDEARVPLISLEDALNRSGIFILLVDHTQFLGVPRERLRGRTIIDTRGSWMSRDDLSDSLFGLSNHALVSEAAE